MLGEETESIVTEDQILRVTEDQILRAAALDRAVALAGQQAGPLAGRDSVEKRIDEVLTMAARFERYLATGEVAE